MHPPVLSRGFHVSTGRRGAPAAFGGSTFLALAFVAALGFVRPAWSQTPIPATPLGEGGGNSSTGGGTSKPGGANDPSAPKTAPEPAVTQPTPNAPSTSGTLITTETAQPKEAPRAPTADIEDRSGWETWWLYNREALLDLHRRVQLAAAARADDLDGAPRTGLPPGVPHDVMELRVVPALETLLERETNPEVLAQGLIALARVAKADPGLALSPRGARLKAALAHPQALVAEAAALALGILGESASVRPLIDVARDTAAGRLLTGRREVPYRQRAFAAYALGLVTARATNEDVRRFAVAGLLELFEEPRSPRDVQVACVTALGLARLPSVPATWQPMAKRASATLAPGTSREALVAYLARSLGNDRMPAIVRAHLVTAIGRLVLGCSPAQKAEIEARFVELLAPAAHQPNEVVQSAALALADLGDAGDSAGDRESRTALMNSVHQGDLDTRHFALLALGQMAACADEDPKAPFAGTADIHRFLLRELDSGRSGVRAWAALALGLCGRALRSSGHAPSLEGTRALAARLKNANSPDEAAACALALGLRGDQTMVDAVRMRLATAGDDQTRSGCSVALGLLGSNESRSLLRKIMAGAAARPAMMREVAVALALLDEPNLTHDLCVELGLAAGSAGQLGLLGALAEVGDAGSLDTLLAWCSDNQHGARVRARAVTALGAVCDLRRLPWNDDYARGANYLAAIETLTNPTGDGVLDLR